MERRFRIRLDELLNDAEVRPSLLNGVMPRLEAFLQPFVQALDSPEQRTNAQHYVQGLLSDLDGKDAESIAYLHDRERQGLQKFIGQADWQHQPMITELARQIGVELGEPDGVLVFDPSAFAKKGTESVGVQRQWCGRLGKVENCQVGIYLGYVSRHEHALVDFRLFLPQEWAKAKRRRVKAGVPEKQNDGAWKHDYLLSNAWVTTPLEEFARVFKAAHRIEECIQRAKGETGLADYQVRTWEGWHHHQTLALMATWFLTRETRRGKNLDTCADAAAGAEDDRPTAEWDLEVRSPGANSSDDESPFEAQRGSETLSLASSQPLAAATT